QGGARYPRISPLTEKKQKEDSLMDNKNVEAKVVQLKTQLLKEGHTRHLLAETDLRSEEHTSELQSRVDLVCRLLLEKKNTITNQSAANSAPSIEEIDGLI